MSSVLHVICEGTKNTILYDISETIIMMSIQILLIITINTIIIQYILLDHNHDGIYL